MATKQVEFSATANLESAHSALTQSGLPEAIHGHSWQVTAKWSVNSATKKSFSEDCFFELKNAVSKLEYNNLNSNPVINEKDVTAESIAILLFKMLSNVRTNANLLSIIVEEEPDCFVEYFEYKDTVTKIKGDLE